MSNDYSSFLLWHEVQRFLTTVEQEEVKRVLGWDKIEHNDTLYNEILSLVEILEPLVQQRKQHRPGKMNHPQSSLSNDRVVVSTTSSLSSLSTATVPSSTVKLLTKLRAQRIHALQQAEEQQQQQPQSSSSSTQNFEKIALQAQIIFFVEKLRQVQLPVDPTIQELVQALNNNSNNTNNSTGKEKSSSSSSRMNSAALSRPTTTSSSNRYSITSTNSSNSKHSTSTSSITNYLHSKESIEDIGIKERLTEGIKLWDIQNIEVQYFISVFKNAIQEEEKILYDDIQYLNQLLIQYADDEYNGILDDDDDQENNSSDEEDDDNRRITNIPTTSNGSSTVLPNTDDIPTLRMLKNTLQKQWLNYETNSSNNSNSTINASTTARNPNKVKPMETDPSHTTLNTSTMNCNTPDGHPPSETRMTTTTTTTTSTSKVSSRLRALRGLPTATEETTEIGVSMNAHNRTAGTGTSSTSVDDEDKFFT